MKIVHMTAAAAAIAVAVPAQAQMVMAQNPQSLVEALQAEGYQAKLDTDKVGDPMIRSGSSGSTFQIFFYNCTNHKACATVQFNSGYDLNKPVTLVTLNEWNRSHRFGRAFLDKENNPIIQMDVDLDDGGISRALFIDNVEFWVSMLPKFEQHIGYRN